MINAYKKKTTPGGLHMLNAFVDKPFIPRAHDSEDSERYWRSGELFSMYHDWAFRYTDAERIFDCGSGGKPHRHCMDTLIAERL